MHARLSDLTTATRHTRPGQEVAGGTPEQPRRANVRARLDSLEAIGTCWMSASVGPVAVLLSESTLIDASANPLGVLVGTCYSERELRAPGRGAPPPSEKLRTRTTYWVCAERRGNRQRGPSYPAGPWIPTRPAVLHFEPHSSASSPNRRSVQARQTAATVHPALGHREGRVPRSAVRARDEQRRIRASSQAYGCSLIADRFY